MKRACVAVIDAARARIFSYTRDDDGRSTLEELVDRVNPGRQAHGMFTDHASAKAGGNPEQRGNTVDDHRGDHVAELDNRFARDVVAELSRLAREDAYRRLVVVAAPKMLGRIRGEIEPLRKIGVSVEEIAQDLTRMTSPQVHDHLAALNVIGPRPGAQPRAR